MTIEINHEVFKDKALATLIHFFISLVVITIVAYLIFFVWYPYPFYQLFVVKEVFWLLVMIDVILGPLCTFIVYKKHKKTLKMDLAVIGLVQLIALVFGIKNIAEARPAWLIYYQDVLYATSPNMLTDEKGNEKPLPYVKQNWGKPKFLQVKKDFHDEGVSNDIPIIYQFDKLEEMPPLEVANKKQSLDFINDYDANFYQKIIKTYPTVKGYLPILTEASMKVPAALISEEGELITIVLEDKDK